MTNRIINGVSAPISTPYHVFRPSLVAEDAHAIRSGLASSLPLLDLFYSTKTNPLPALLSQMADAGWGIEMVSPGDRAAAYACGAPADRLLLNGAAWTRDELEDALFTKEIGQATVDSTAMAELLLQCLRESSRDRAPLRVAFRIHDGESHFGFATDAAELARTSHRLAALPPRRIGTYGLQLHRNPPGSAASPAHIAGDFASRAETLLAVAPCLARSPTFFDLGGGLDSPWVYRPAPAELADFHHPSRGRALRGSHPLPQWDLRETAGLVARAVARAMKPLPEARIQFELGRAVCTRALSTVITVRSVKRGLYPDAAILLTDGNTALLGPLHRGIHPVRAHYARTGEERVFVYGNLPHSGDWLMQDLTLPPAEIGDQIEILHTGAYFLPLEARFGCALPAIVHESTGEVLRPGR